MPTIPVNEPLLGKREEDLVLDCVRTGWISSAGSYLTQFESGWAAYCGRRHGIAVANGTVALELAVRALDASPGEEVILPSFTIISCANAVVLAGLKPVLVDVDPVTFTMRAADVARKITEKTRAVMAVHIYGHPCD